MSEFGELLPIRSLIEGCWPGEWGSDPSGDDGNCVVFRATDIDSEGHLNLEGGASRDVLSSKLKAKSLQIGDILLEASGGAPDKPVGRVALVNQQPCRPSLTSNFFRFIRPVKSIDARFFLFQLVALNKSSSIWKYQQQTTGLINLKVEDYLRHKVWSPSKAHQKRIADILTGIDTTIEKTAALIAKYQQIKSGLMHDLFTRGVLPNGQLRPPREQAPELYQQTAIGWIPRGWQFELLDKLASRGSGHTPNKNIPEYWNGGIKWVSLADSHRLDQLYISDTEFQISHQGIQNSSAVLHPAGIVVLSRDAGVGKSAITTEPMAVSQHFMCWKCDQRMDNHFLYYWLQFHKRTFENIAMGSTILTIGLPYFKKMKVACPVDLEEQRNIAAKLKAVDARMLSLQDELSKLKKKKQGLMQDLLTGKVLVKIKEPDMADGSPPSRPESEEGAGLARARRDNPLEVFDNGGHRGHDALNKKELA
ncbi:MAG: restriction endonuclease subunit S [Pseudomonadota bacterium]